MNMLIQYFWFMVHGRCSMFHHVAVWRSEILSPEQLLLNLTKLLQAEQESNAFPMLYWIYSMAQYTKLKNIVHDPMKIYNRPTDHINQWTDNQRKSLRKKMLKALHFFTTFWNILISNEITKLKSLFLNPETGGWRLVISITSFPQVILIILL